MLLYALLFVSGESLVPVGYFTNLDDCLNGARFSVFVENGKPAPNPFDYLCVKVELPLN